MFRWAGWARIGLILVVLLIAIGVPVVVSGYADVKRASTANEHKDFVRAAQYYQAAALKLPWKPGLWEQAAMAKTQVPDWLGALMMFDRLSRRGILSAAGWETYGTLYYSTGYDQGAIRIWTAGIKAYPSDTRFYYLFSLAYHHMGDYSAEQLWLERWIATGHGSVLDHFELGSLLLISDPSRARRELLQAESMDAGFSSAVQTLDSALALAGQEADSSRREVILSRALGLVNDWPLAQYDFQQAVNADPKNAEAWAWLGEAQQQNKQDGKAALDRALELDPNNSLVHGLRGLYWKRQGKAKAALAEYQTAAKLEPKNPDWQAALGDAYASTGDLVQALAAYVTATDLAPDNATYWRLLALFCADNGVQVLDVGLPAAKKAAEIAPNDPQVLDALGWMYAQAGLLNTAEQTLNKAIKIAPDSASAHLHLAETYLREGQASFAQSELNRVVQLNGNGPYGTFAAQLLKQYFP